MRFGRNHPDFGDGDAFVIAQFSAYIVAGLARGQDFDNQLWRGVNITIPFDNACADKNRKIGTPLSHRIAAEDQTENCSDNKYGFVIQLGFQ